MMHDALITAEHSPYGTEEDLVHKIININAPAASLGFTGVRYARDLWTDLLVQTFEHGEA